MSVTESETRLVAGTYHLHSHVMFSGEVSPCLRDGSGQQSLLSTMTRFVQAVREMDETIMIPHRLKDISPESVAPCGGSVSGPAEKTPTHNTSLVSVACKDLELQNGDLFAFYKMLNTIRTELVRGHECSEEEENLDESSKEVAAAFRHHLQGLFGLLKQLTATAQHVTNRYQEEIGDIPSTKLSPFTL